MGLALRRRTTICQNPPCQQIPAAKQQGSWLTRPLELLTSATLYSQLYTRSHIKTTRYSLRDQTETKLNSSLLIFVNYLAHLNCPTAGDSNFIKINTLETPLIHSYQLGSSPGAF
jgi:hypothetical protein